MRLLLFRRSVVVELYGCIGGISLKYGLLTVAGSELVHFNCAYIFWSLDVLM